MSSISPSNVLPPMCIAFISWEIQDNLKLRSVIVENILTKNGSPDPKTSCHSCKNNGEVTGDNKPDVSYGDDAVPTSFVTLRPFMHPELIDTSRDACELRLQCESRHNLKIHTIVLLVTARNSEVYDRRGEYLETVRGTAIPSSSGGNELSGWYRFEYNLTEPEYEIKFKFLSLHEVGKLKLGRITANLERHKWASVDYPDSSLSVSSLLERLSEVELTAQARSLLNLVSASAPAASRPHTPNQSQSVHAVNNLKMWLDSRLDLFERRVDERLRAIESRLDQLEKPSSNSCTPTPLIQ